MTQTEVGSWNILLLEILNGFIESFLNGFIESFLCIQKRMLNCYCVSLLSQIRENILINKEPIIKYVTTNGFIFLSHFLVSLVFFPLHSFIVIWFLALNTSQRKIGLTNYIPMRNWKCARLREQYSNIFKNIFFIKIHDFHLFSISYYNLALGVHW